MESRVNRLLESMESQKIDGVLIQNPFNRRYISLFTGSAGYLYISRKQQVLLTDFRYMEQASAQAPNFKIVDHTKKGLYDTLNNLIQEDHIVNLGFEATAVTYGEYDEYRQKLRVDQLTGTYQLVEKLRMIKDENEIKNIRKAAEIADAAFEHIILYLKAGAVERDIALELEFFMKKQGASNLSFDTIVASGYRSSLPHGAPSEKVIEEGDFVTMDFGCIYNGYCSDMTRTVVIGKADERQKAIYETVLNAQLKALEGLRPGKTGKEVDKIARDYITDRGYGDYFGHGFGHSLGLEVHENPRLSLLGDQVLEAGMLATAEPGIYIPDFGGVRIEDLVVLTQDGMNNLTSSPKHLMIL